MDQKLILYHLAEPPTKDELVHFRMVQLLVKMAFQWRCSSMELKHFGNNYTICLSSYGATKSL